MSFRPKVLFVTGLTDLATTDVEGKGTERTDNNGNTYRWVYNASTVATRVGQPVCYDASLYAAATFLQHILSNPADQ